MRHLHRTVVARLLAGCLLLLAASPVTAPFTTCELSDFIRHHHPADHPTPATGRQAAEPTVKIAGPVQAEAILPIPVISPLVTDSHSVAPPLVAVVQTRERLQTVLRL
jgi:hypothetical protein